VLGTLLPLNSSAAHRNTDPNRHAILAVLSRVGCNWVCHLFFTRTLPRGGANRRYDCDCCRPDTLGGGNQSRADHGCFKNPGESLSLNEYSAPTARVTPLDVCDTSGVWANAEEFWPPRPQSVMWRGIRKLTHYWILWRLQWQVR